ncbi:hypothetical protein [Mycobacterium servetii]|uniref:Uncharacterized protein n=1 Tax=Mycobacterium servetii TaxID=3237418 RepID=A0ABV4C184_9MYCO
MAAISATAPDPAVAVGVDQFANAAAADASSVHERDAAAAEPAEIAAVAAFLLSPAPSYLNGPTVAAFGGWMCGDTGATALRRTSN